MAQHLNVLQGIRLLCCLWIVLSHTASRPDGTWSAISIYLRRADLAVLYVRTRRKCKSPRARRRCC